VRNKTEKRIEFTDTPPVAWIETVNKVRRTHHLRVHLRWDMYKLTPGYLAHSRGGISGWKAHGILRDEKGLYPGRTSLGGTNKDRGATPNGEAEL
jgi:hypothetical protein